MSRILLIDDDVDQLDIRRLILEHAGHSIAIANNESDALTVFNHFHPDIVLVDLRLQREGAGLDLIREFRTCSSTVRIVVLSGWAHDLAGRVEAAMVDAVVPKPAQSQRLLGTLARLAMLALLVSAARAESFDFTVPATGEITARLSLSAPGKSWSRIGAEAALADVRIDDQTPFNVMVFADRDYPVFLGKLAPGRHRLIIERNAGELKVNGATFEATTDEAVLRAPVLYARANTIGKFTDVPLLVYAEDDGDFLQYTVIFSNEDGGTSTRALMARWGRTTDIEYVYRLNKRSGVAIIQGKDHHDIEYSGKLEGLHPVLMPITDNNMVGPVVDPPPPIRYQITPLKVDLHAATREQVMAQHPFTYRIAAEELKREGKLREFGKVDGEKISDPRNYLYVDALVSNRSAGLSVTVRLKDDPIWRSADLGRADYAISRNGWVQTTIELPPGTRPEQIAEIGLQCVVSPGPSPDRRMPQSGDCHVDQVQQAFMLDQDYKPAKSIWSMKTPIDIPTGQTQTYKAQ